MKAGGTFSSLSAYYDLLYEDKNYGDEVDFLENIFKTAFRGNRLQSILELGCGTGNYTKILLDRGYDVTAIDISQDMLDIARMKCQCPLIRGDLKDITLNEKYDACISMFAVMGYITKNSDVVRSIKNVRRHLKRGGAFIFDVWNGLAVMNKYPECRVKEAEDDRIKVIRLAMPKMRPYDHICEVDYKLIAQNKETFEFKEINEKHVMRFYFPQEIRHYLESEGFEVLKICPTMDLKGVPDENAWNMTVAARLCD